MSTAYGAGHEIHQIYKNDKRILKDYKLSGSEKKIITVQIKMQNN